MKLLATMLFAFGILVTTIDCGPTSMKSINKKIDAYTQEKTHRLLTQVADLTTQLEQCREHRQSLVQHIQQLNKAVKHKRVRFQSE